MEKKNYYSPCVDVVELLSESCLAASTGDTELYGVNPEDWDQGNTNWW